MQNTDVRKMNAGWNRVQPKLISSTDKYKSHYCFANFNERKSYLQHWRRQALREEKIQRNGGKALEKLEASWNAHGKKKMAYRCRSAQGASLNSDQEGWEAKEDLRCRKTTRMLKLAQRPLTSARYWPKKRAQKQSRRKTLIVVSNKYQLSDS